MTCEIPRTYLPTPQLLNTGDSLPTVPTNPNDWDGMRRLLEAIRQSLGGSSTAQNTTSAPQVTNFVATTKAGGTLLTWDFNLNGGYYILYRGTSNDLSAAYTMGIVTEGNTRRGQFLDACGQEAAGTTIYYWLQPYTLGGIPGPVSIAVKASVSCGGATNYSEDFRRGDQPFVLGNNWFDVYNQSSGVGESTLAAAVNCSVSGATFGAVGTNAVSRVFFTPIPVDFAQIATKVYSGVTMFTETIWDGGAGGGTSSDCGLSMMYGPNNNEYDLNIIKNGQCDLYRGLIVNNAGAVQLQANVCTIVAGDTLRMETNYTAATNTIRVYKNGVLQTTVTDSSVNRCNGFMYGIGFFGWNVSTQTWRTFSGGF